jgi:hypothetical protein
VQDDTHTLGPAQISFCPPCMQFELTVFDSNKLFADAPIGKSKFTPLDLMKDDDPPGPITAWIPLGPDKGRVLVAIQPVLS